MHFTFVFQHSFSLKYQWFELCSWLVWFVIWYEKCFLKWKLVNNWFEWEKFDKVLWFLSLTNLHFNVIYMWLTSEWRFVISSHEEVPYSKCRISYVWLHCLLHLFMIRFCQLLNLPGQLFGQITGEVS